MKLPKDSRMTRLQKQFYTANLKSCEPKPYDKQEILDIQKRGRNLTLDAIWQRFSSPSSAS